MIPKKIISRLPSTFGVYQLLKNKTPIYVGKSVNIKARINSHITSSRFDEWEKKLFSEADDIIYTATVSDFTALLLEAKLISLYQPKYNRISKDDKSPLYIRVDIKNEFPKITVSRKVKDPNSIYFGPFPSKQITQSLIYDLRKIIPFCTQKNVTKRACFYKKLNLCNPCPNEINNLSGNDRDVQKKLYLSQIKALVKILSGNFLKIEKQLLKKINDSNKTRNYEESKKLFSRLQTLQYLSTQKVFPEIDDLEINREEIFERMTQLENVAEVFGNGEHQNRIECFDISNLGKSDAVGGMSVYFEGNLDKSQYKKFKIKTIKQQSDFWMLQEMISRRLSHPEWGLPRAIILDGGRPQIEAILILLKKLQKEKILEKYNFVLASIAKRPDRIYLHTKLGTKRIDVGKSDFFQLIVSLRDEVHRFSNKYHRQLRDKNLFTLKS